MPKVYTTGLRHGVAVLLPGPNGNIIRTIAGVSVTKYRNQFDKKLWMVRYREGATPEWSGTNFAPGDAVWQTVEIPASSVPAEVQS